MSQQLPILKKAVIFVEKFITACKMIVFDLEN